MPSTVQRIHPLTYDELHAVSDLFALADAAAGNQPDDDIDVLEMLCALGSRFRHRTGATRIGGELAGVVWVADGEAVLRVRPGAPAEVAHELIAQAESWLDADGATSAVTWVPAADEALRAGLLGRGWRFDYTDVQMVRRLPESEPRSLPTGVAVRPSTGYADLGVVHDLLCAAWRLTPPWAEFVPKLVGQPGYDPALWLLGLEDERVVGVALGAVEGDAGRVRHLAVAPDRRGVGVGSGLLSALLAEFTRLGLGVAGLGVHLDNASGAHGLYLRRRWLEVSRYDRWVRTLA